MGSAVGVVGMLGWCMDCQVLLDKLFGWQDEFDKGAAGYTGTGAIPE